MTRYKKELKKRGFKLESDFPFLPYELKTGGTLETIKTEIVAPFIVYKSYYCELGWCRTYLDKNFNEIKLSDL